MIGGKPKLPYITQEARKEVANIGPTSAGELNYAISMLLVEYWKKHNNYQGINDIVGALVGAQAEFYRRVAVPYENKKIFDNGDIY
jgi:hypothetical protein